MPIKRIPLVGSLTNRSADAEAYDSYDQQFQNCFWELNKNPVTGQGTVHLIKRQGLTCSNSKGAPTYNATSGAIAWLGNSGGIDAAIPYLDGTALRIYDRSSGIIGAGLTAHTTGFKAGVLLSETQISGVSTLVCIARESATDRPYAWWIAQGGGAWAEITDADFPPNQGTPLTIVGNAVHMDGYMFVMDSTGKIWNSDINSVVNWTSTSFISAQVIPDGGSGMGKSGPYIWAFGTNSAEPFVNAGNATGSPLQRVQGGARRIGALRAKSGQITTIQTIGDSIYFIGTEGDSGTMGIYRIDRTDIKKISPPAVDRLLLSNLSENVLWGIAGSFQMFGMMHVMFYTGAAKTLCFCPATNCWWYLRHGYDIVFNGALGMADSTLGVAYSILTSETTTNNRAIGFYINLSSTAGLTFTDSDTSTTTAYTMSMQTSPMDMGSDKLKDIMNFNLIGDTETTAGTVTLSWSDDDYQTFVGNKTIDMTKIQKQIQSGLGVSRRRAWKLTDTASRPFRAEAFEVEWDQAES